MIQLPICVYLIILNLESITYSCAWTKLKTTPNFYKKIKYQESNPEQCLKYLSSNELIQDINTLEKIMATYAENNISEFEIYYG